MTIGVGALMAFIFGFALAVTAEEVVTRAGEELVAAVLLGLAVGLAVALIRRI